MISITQISIRLIVRSGPKSPSKNQFPDFAAEMANLTRIGIEALLWQ